MTLFHRLAGRALPHNAGARMAGCGAALPSMPPVPLPPRSSLPMPFPLSSLLSSLPPPSAPSRP
jgi:hypothetical protein